MAGHASQPSAYLHNPIRPTISHVDRVQMPNARMRLVDAQPETSFAVSISAPLPILCFILSTWISRMSLATQHFFFFLFRSSPFFVHSDFLSKPKLCNFSELQIYNPFSQIPSFFFFEKTSHRFFFSFLFSFIYDCFPFSFFYSSFSFI